MYDADCGPCTRFKRLVDFLDSYQRIGFTSLTEADGEGILDTVPALLRHRSYHLISPAGEVLSGAKAIPALVGLLPTGSLVSKLITRAPGGLRATGFVYAVLSRLHDTGSCQYKPGQGHAHGSTKELFERPFDFIR